MESADIGIALLPHVGPIPAAVRKALSSQTGRYGFRLVREEIDPEDNEAYWGILSHWWKKCAEETLELLVVEHDIVLAPGTVMSFTECPNEWCVAPYPYLNGIYGGLGCVRFRWSLMRGTAGVWHEIAKMESPGHPPKSWCTLDAWLQRALYERNVRTCRKHPQADHLGDHWPSHGCVKREKP